MTRIRMTRLLYTAAASLALIGSAALGQHAAAPSGTFNRADWLEDYAALKAAMIDSYANLAWFASPEGGIDLPALDRRTTNALRQATTEDEARFALRGFVSAFHDGHLSELPALEAPHGAAAEPPARDLRADDAASACAARGYADRSQVAFSLPFESLPGFSLESDGASSAFRAGTITISGRRIGIVRLKNFSQRQYPTECLRAWTTSDEATRADAEAFDQRVTALWFETLAAQLARFRSQGVSIVIVDVGNNSGGNDSGDAAARLFTARPVRSAPLLMSAAAPATVYLNEQIDALRGAATSATGGDARTALSAAAAFEARKAAVASRHCNLSWAWTERRAWQPRGCSRLVEVGSAAGAYDYLPPASVHDRRVAATVYWPAAVDQWRGSWDGPTYVLTSGSTYSAAEMFTAVMRDNGIARTVGARTGGDGCGFMSEVVPFVLPHSRMRFRMSNCVRLRRDGTNEVAGIAPDLPMPALEGESPRARAMRLLDAVASDRPAGQGRD